MPRYHLETLGCRVNLADSFALAAGLERLGYHRAERAGDADLVVVNSCTVTGRADADLRQLVARLRRGNPAAQIVVTGCAVAVGDPAERLAALPGASAVAPRAELLERIARAPERGSRHGPGPAIAPDAVPAAGAGTLWDTPIDYPQFPASGHTRAFVKVQDGCDARCSFCIIPATRGKSRSRPLRQVVDAVRQLGESGAREVVLTGIHLGSYGRDLGTSLVALLDALEGLDRPERIRLSSVEPNEVTPDLVARMAQSPRLAPHVHLPLQSGSDRILRAMRRPYTAAAYARAVAAVAGRLEAPAIGADVIAGFPGETEADFAATLALVSALPLSYLHVFRYSPRPGTAALGLSGAVPEPLAIARSRELRARGRALEQAFAAGRIGRIEQALTLAGDGRRSAALTGRFLTVELDRPWPSNALLEVRVRGLAGGRLQADPVGGEEAAA